MRYDLQIICRSKKLSLNVYTTLLLIAEWRECSEANNRSLFEIPRYLYIYIYIYVIVIVRLVCDMAQTQHEA